MPLASLVDVGTWEVGLADYAVLAPNPVVTPDTLDGLLADALFGEVIDISDLIPRLLSPSADAATPAFPAGAAGTAELGLTDGGDALAVSSHADALTILYDDDILLWTV